MPSRFLKSTYFYLGAIFIILLVLGSVGGLSFLQRPLRFILSPFVISINELSVKTADGYRLFKNQREFFDAFQKCQEDSQNKNVVEAELKILQEENVELKKQAGFFEKNNLARVIARVIGKNMDSTEKTIVIDKGAEAGLKENQAVIAGGGILVGKISSLQPDIAMVRLVNDNRSKIAATVLNKDKSLGVVEGGYGLSVRMSFIPRNEAVSVGDQIVTSGLEKEFPRGLLIGTVAAVENEAYQPFQEAVLAPAVDISKLILVSVLVSF